MSHSRFQTARKLLIFWTFFIGLGAVAGAAAMLIDPSGRALGMDAMLPFFQVLPFAGVLFQNFIFSGWALLIVNGLSNLTAACLLLAKKKAGVVLGGVSGYFGGWVDNLIMRIVDIFYCIPSTPLIIILGAAMDGMRVDPQIRMLYLMLILGFLGWPGIARLVRGQILSLREQEFMTATEACGISVSRRIFRHLIPNVIPQLIVNCTMSLGSTIITEATLSFLGLGVKFPFASWGNIMNDVSNSYVLTSYWFIWIPAGICLMLTVLGFNFVGDGLRDAFDPKMKR